MKGKPMTQITPQINFVTRKAYKGDMAEILHNVAIAKGYTSNEWATMNQWNKTKRSVAPDQHGVPFTYTRILESDEGSVEQQETTWLYNRYQLRRVSKA